MARCLRPVILLGLIITSVVLASPQNLSTRRSVSAALSGLPLGFEKNQGQMDARVLYRAHAPSSTVFLTMDGATLAWKSGALRMVLADADPAAKLSAEQQLPGKVNYLMGDAKKWRTDIPTFERVKYAGVYPGVDLVFYGKQGRLEYDFAVAPGADAGSIRFRTEGVDTLNIASNGDLTLRVGKQQIRWQKPVTYQEINGRRQSVSSRYKLIGNQVAFEIGAYDKSRRLIIDPTLVYSTYLGGSTSADPFEPGGPGTAYNDATGIAVDSSGNTYVAGITGATDFPVTAGAYDTTENGSACDPRGPACTSGYVAKLNSSGTALLYSTYFGGHQSLTGLAIDSSGRAYVVGYFQSGGANVPITANAFQTPFSCDSGPVYAYLSVLNGAGNGLVYSTAYGTQTPENCAGSTSAFSVTVGTTGLAYVVGQTNDSDLTTRNAYQSINNGEDVWLATFDPSKSGDASLLYATYLGGPGFDFATNVATEGGRAYVVGEAAAGFPTTANARTRTIDADHSGFVAKIDTNASGVASLIWSTYMARGPNNRVHGISLLGNVPYLTGVAECCGFPTTSGAFQATQKSCPTGSSCLDAWVVKLKTDGSGFQYSTDLSGSGDDNPAGIAVDGNGVAWVAGGTWSSDYPTTSDAFQRQYHPATCNTAANTPCQDAFLTGVKASGSSLAYSTYFGGVGDDYAAGVTVRNGFVYIAGRTGSSAFPTTNGAFSRTKSGYLDAFIAKFSTSASCSAPTTSRTIHLCSPVNSSSVKSPVHVQATAKAGASAIKSMQVYVDGVKKYDLPNSTRIDTFLSMAKGARRVTVQAIDSSGAFRTTVNITVQ
jgi:hypothetical protein